MYNNILSGSIIKNMMFRRQLNHELKMKNAELEMRRCKPSYIGQGTV